MQSISALVSLSMSTFRHSTITIMPFIPPQSLFKVPLLLLTAYANFITFTPPNPRAAPDERGKYSTVKYIVRQVRPPWVRALEKVRFAHSNPYTY